MDADTLNRLVVDSIRGLGIYFVYPEGKIALWSKGVELELGYLAGEVLDRDEAMLYASGSQAEMATSGEEGRLAKLLRRDGSSLIAIVITHPVHDAIRRIARILPRTGSQSR